jgi:hypothetical protein
MSGLRGSPFGGIPGGLKNWGNSNGGMLQAGYALMNFLCPHVEIVGGKMAKALNWFSGGFPGHQILDHDAAPYRRTAA